MSAPAGKLPIVILISGRGSNLQAIIDQAVSGGLPVEIRAVISNVPGVHGLERARQAGIETQVLDHRGFPDRATYDRALMELIDGYAPGLVVLAGFMRILTPDFVRHYARRLLNIHPSLLPRHRGLNTHARALEEGDAEHGASVHLVTEELDGGPVLIQAQVPIRPDDDPDTLAARVLEQEHRLYPEAIRWFAEGRIDFDGEQVRLDGRPLTEPVRLET
ncbi:phosphoribosylglycinamide formyltransferase [Thiohalobacter thiocyanaticus]|uniref:Phosphoribosylglycinamide formyltransferase n=1 Tax=Thiohalobacter thiocyanaticus TaxID=585455 RepID=A0A426QHM6_9GAMM|nr:phosphoribosylglycinamide formyltransferase [Thiohalobacter thiocyanaticus]RRQ21216.1 phosphoribosylglycinamide formyltransferase [Thiohalobacter thiocyanaticus]